MNPAAGLRPALVVLAVVTTTFGAETFPEKTGRQWAPFLEWSVKNPSHDGNPFDVTATVRFVHESGQPTHTTGMFFAGGGTWKFRFCGTRPGRWRFTTKSSDAELNGHRGSIRIEANTDRYGFVVGVGDKWARQRGPAGQPEAFVPQFVMYASPHLFHRKPKMIDRDIRTFIVEHGFTGFHVPINCRWFDLDQAASSQIDSDDPDPDPRTFEALEVLITKVHAAGGTVHLWAWGDESRRQTPIKWGINGQADRRLQRYLAARLGPIPGWSIGYGFDLWEWVEGPQLTGWHRHLHAHLGWPHLLGGRAHKNRLTQISESLDYSSYEQHRPDFATYKATIARRPKKPSFSEDRFRIRQSRQYAAKDYTEVMTRRGLWHSAMAGGVANIWGNLQGDFAVNRGEGVSKPYSERHWIKTFNVFFHDRGRFTLDSLHAARLSDGSGLRRPTKGHFVFYKEDTRVLTIDLSSMNRNQPAVAVDTTRGYREISLGRLSPGKHELRFPRQSDWAVAVGTFNPRRK